jgi:hypothetical protein
MEITLNNILQLMKTMAILQNQQPARNGNESERQELAKPAELVK